MTRYGRAFIAVIILCLIANRGICNEGDWRTLSGVLRANLVLNCQAMVADQSGQTVSISNNVEVRVGQVADLRVQYAGPRTTTVQPIGWLGYSVVNKGNGEDTFDFTLLQDEQIPNPRWALRLFEDRNGNGVAEGPELITTSSTPLIADERRHFLIELRPPSDLNTDGLWLTLLCSSAFDPTRKGRLGYVAGAQGALPPLTRVALRSNQILPVAPVYYLDRLYWLGEDIPNNRTALFVTPNPFETTGGFSNNVQFLGYLNTLVFDFQSLLHGSKWYLATSSQELFVKDLAPAVPPTSWYRVPLPPLTQLDPTVPLVADDTSVYFVGLDRRLYRVEVSSDQVSSLPLRSPVLIRTLAVLSENLLAAGCNNGLLALLNRSTGLVTWIPLPTSNAIRLTPQYDPITRFLYVVAGRTLYVLNLATGGTVWTFDTQTDIVSPVVYDLVSRTCYFLTADRRLWGLDANTGQPLALYPQTLFQAGRIERADLRLLRRSDRQNMPYLYALAQLWVNNIPQPAFVMITAINPLNRIYGKDIPADATPGNSLVVTGTSPNSFILPWFANSPSLGRGFIWGFGLR